MENIKLNGKNFYMYLYNITSWLAKENYKFIVSVVDV